MTLGVGSQTQGAAISEGSHPRDLDYIASPIRLA